MYFVLFLLSLTPPYKSAKELYFTIRFDLKITTTLCPGQDVKRYPWCAT